MYYHSAVVTIVLIILLTKISLFTNNSLLATSLKCKLSSKHNKIEGIKGKYNPIISYVRNNESVTKYVTTLEQWKYGMSFLDHKIFTN